MKKLILFLILNFSVTAQAVTMKFEDSEPSGTFYLKITAVAISSQGIEFATQYKGVVCILDDKILAKSNISGLDVIEKIQTKSWEKVTIVCNKIDGQYKVTRITSSENF